MEYNVLRYFFQYKAATDYLEHGITEDIFVDPLYKQLFYVYSVYVKTYKSIPDSLNLISFMQDQGVEDNIISAFRSAVDQIMVPLFDIPIVEHSLLKHIKKEMHTRALQDSLNTLDDNWDETAVTKLYKKISEVNSLDIHNNGSGHMFLQNWSAEGMRPTPHPTCLKSFNQIIGRNGFFAPQLIGIMGGAKSMKTTLMLHLALGYIKDGLPVTFVDWENHKSTLTERLNQMIVNTRLEYLYEDNVQKALQDRLQEIRSMSTADLHIINLRKRKDGVDAAERIIDQKANVDGITPKAVFFDYLDIAGSSDKSLKDKREKIQQAYADAVVMNQKYGCFSFTVSKMQRGANEKQFVTENDVAEDYEKAYNVDALFALMRNSEDIEMGRGRIIPIVQRTGVSHQEIEAVIDMDGATMQIRDALV